MEGWDEIGFGGLHGTGLGEGSVVGFVNTVMNN
jgi:hypothetical protein